MTLRRLEHPLIGLFSALECGFVALRFDRRINGAFCSGSSIFCSDKLIYSQNKEYQNQDFAYIERGKPFYVSRVHCFPSWFKSQKQTPDTSAGVSFPVFLLKKLQICNLFGAGVTKWPRPQSMHLIQFILLNLYGGLKNWDIRIPLFFCMQNSYHSGFPLRPTVFRLKLCGDRIK